MKDNKLLFLDDNYISVNLSGHGNVYQFSIYNDKTDKAVATQINREQLKRLADFIYKYLENNNDQ